MLSYKDNHVYFTKWLAAVYQGKSGPLWFASRQTCLNQAALPGVGFLELLEQRLLVVHRPNNPLELN
jgi:hypothetical protein